jgi:hypothetical protein
VWTILGHLGNLRVNGTFAKDAASTVSADTIGKVRLEAVNTAMSGIIEADTSIARVAVPALDFLVTNLTSGSEAEGLFEVRII